MRKFETKTALAKELNITRSTLYARASKYGVDLNALDTEGLTDEQIKVLSTDMSVASDVELQKEVGRLKAEIERLNNLNKNLESERQTAQTEASSYKEKFEELNADYIIPAAFDPRVKDAVANAVKQAAYDSGVARI